MAGGSEDPRRCIGHVVKSFLRRGKEIENDSRRFSEGNPKEAFYGAVGNGPENAGMA